jgi:hypothetical protein
MPKCKADKLAEKNRAIEIERSKFFSKRDKIVDKEELTASDILKYFKYENLVKQEPKFCPLFKSKEKCHDGKNIFCWNCYCDEYDLSCNDGLIGKCKTKSKKAKYTNGILDCSDCTYPH